MNGAVGNGEIQEASVEIACQEYNTSVKLILTLINRQLDEILAKNYDDLEELAEKIAARASFLENNPDFLSSLTYRSSCVKIRRLSELDEIKITLKEYSRRIVDKTEEIDRFHNSLYELVEKNSQEQRKKRVEEYVKALKPPEEEEVFEDCLTKAEAEGEIREKLKAEIDSLLEIHADAENRAEEETAPENHVEAEAAAESHTKEETAAENHTEAETPAEQEEAKSTVDKLYFDRVLIQKNAYSDVSLDKRITDNLPKLSLKHLFPDVPADVERRKPLEDLHGKLLKQLEASDSLESFVKLMERKPSKQPKPVKEGKNGEEIEEKYTGSLWFFPEKPEKSKKHNPPSPSSSQKSTKAIKAKKQNFKSSTCCELLITSSQSPPTNQEKTKKIRESLGRTKLKYYDLLDDLEGKDLKPIKSEYPRRDNLYEKYMKKMKLHEAKSYLHRMMEENEKVWKKLLQPPEPRKVKRAKTLMKYLTAPEQKFLDHRPQTLIVMPVKIVYDNFPTKESGLPETPRKPAILITDLTTQAVAERPAESPRRQQVIVAEAGPKVPEASQSPAFPPQRKKEILEHLKGLKIRNDNIQKNIQKAIDVVETKMIDLLSSPTENNNEDAFLAMEEEIRNVLKMMSESETMKAEKDVNAVKSPRLRKAKTIVKTPRALSPAPKPRRTKPTKKTANIEEGERLLGQVDSVIKKIDNMSTKFSEDKKLSKKESSYNDVIDFFDGLRNILENQVWQACLGYVVVSRASQEAVCYRQFKVYHRAVLILPQPVIEPVVSDVIEPVMSDETETQTDLEEENEIEIQIEIEEIEEMPTREKQIASSGIEEVEQTRSKRYQTFLKRFYTFFFSTVFVALNFDYAA